MGQEALEFYNLATGRHLSGLEVSICEYLEHTRGNIQPFDNLKHMYIILITFPTCTLG